MAGNTVCSKRKHFNRPRSISLFSFFFKRLPSPDTNAVTDSFYGKELGLPFLLHFLRSDRLAPYCPRLPSLLGSALAMPAAPCFSLPQLLPTATWWAGSSDGIALSPSGGLVCYFRLAYSAESEAHFVSALLAFGLSLVASFRDINLVLFVLSSSVHVRGFSVVCCLFLV